MRVDNISLGTIGEIYATEYLSKQGYKIIEKNFKKRYGEIDIVALDDNTLVFIEVKTRTGSSFGSGEEAITPWKLKSLISCAHYYKLIHPKLPESMRIDLVSILLSQKTDEIEEIKLYKNISS